MPDRRFSDVCMSICPSISSRMRRSSRGLPLVHRTSVLPDGALRLVACRTADSLTSACRYAPRSLQGCVDHLADCLSCTELQYCLTARFGWLHAGPQIL